MKIKKDNSNAYEWGQQCKGWHLVNTKDLSVIQELMPQGTAEVNHKHLKAQQFFFILKGKATFLINGEKHHIKQHEGIHILPNIYHQIRNETDTPLEFIVISQPHTRGDRIDEALRDKSGFPFII